MPGSRHHVQRGSAVRHVHHLVIVVEDEVERLAQTRLVVDHEDDGAKAPGAIPRLGPRLRCHGARM
jgi:hypothetical protein